MAISGFHHFSLSCHDADRSLAFYRDVFGLEVVADRVVEPGGFVARVTGIPGAGVRIVHLRGHGVNLELLEFSEPRGAERATPFQETGGAHTCFVTEDMDAEVERLRRLGVPFRSSEVPVTVVGGPNDGGQGVYVEDPDGIPVEILQLARPWPGEER